MLYGSGILLYNIGIIHNLKTMEQGQQLPTLDSGSSKFNFNKKTLYIVVAVIVLLVVTNGIAFYYLMSREPVQESTPLDDQKLIDEGSIYPSVNISDDSTDKDEVVEDSDDEVTDTDKDELDLDIALRKDEILVDWNDWPVQTTSWQFFDYQDFKGALEETITDVTTISTDHYIRLFKVYKAGQIKKGQYVDSDLYIVMYTPEGPAFRDNMFRVVKHDNELVRLTKYSDEAYGFIEKLFVSNDKIEIHNLETPDTIKIPGSTLKLEKTDEEPYMLLSSYDNPEKLFKYNGTDYVYKSKHGDCYIVEAQDGTTREYYYELDFLGREGESTQYHGMVPTVLDLTWSDGTKHIGEYIFKSIGGCGPSGCYSYADYITGTSMLTVVGTAKGGDKIYELKDKEFKEEGHKTGVLRMMYDTYFPGYDAERREPKAKMSFEDFVAEHPLIYWQDPFGDLLLLEMRNIYQQLNVVSQ